jgi:hypothetical protein
MQHKYCIAKSGPWNAPRSGEPYRAPETHRDCREIFAQAGGAGDLAGPSARTEPAQLWKNSA